MWMCNRCGREHERLSNARCCSCRDDTKAARSYNRWLLHSLRALVVRVALGPVIGGALGAFEFNLAGIHPAEGYLLGAQVGLAVGVVWGMVAWSHALFPPPRQAA